VFYAIASEHEKNEGFGGTESYDRGISETGKTGKISRNDCNIEARKGYGYRELATENGA